jgi:hypothetical protein
VLKEKEREKWEMVVFQMEARKFEAQMGNKFKLLLFLF